MEVRCSICGAREEITKVHKDYRKLARDVNATFTCELCQQRMIHQAKLASQPKRPI